ncbi:MAG: C10 family peptidase [Bacteroidales bacterium]|nr:C10 family peptidase [Bacteroidales bacterium]MCF8404874.1 C10 family peptidase [Bacteroidales bacterium]
MKSTLLFVFSIFIIHLNALCQSVSEAEVKTAATHFYFERATSDPIHYSGIHISEVIPVMYNQTLVYYAVNLNPVGFVLVSPDRSVKPVLAYSFNNGYKEEDQHPAFSAWILQYKKQMEFALQKKIIPSPEITAEWERLLKSGPSKLKKLTKDDSVEPMLISNWDQGQFYNQMCPQDPGGPGGYCYTGCVATAMGQLCYYFRWPDNGIGSYSYQHPDYGTISASFEETDYQWNSMSNTLNQPNIAVAELLFHLGAAVDMVYGPNGSGMYNHKAAYALRTHFKFAPETEYLYRDSTSLDWDSTIVAHLDQGIPMYYAGWSVPNINGHAFIVDGYQTEEYFHFNWGWGGSYDGYFYLDNLSPGGSNFNLAQELIIHASPDTETYTYPPYCNTPEVLTSLNGTLEDGSGPQYNYNNNLDCTWLISTQSIQDSVSYISLNFDRINTELNEDIITLYDGEFDTDPILGMFSGNAIPGTITSTGNKVLVHFESNSTNIEAGWFLSYHSTQPVWCNGMQIFTEPDDSFSDGSGDFYYRNGSACMWNIQPTDASEVTIYFTSFDTEEFKDEVKIYDAGTNQMLETYSGTYSSAALPPPVTSYSGKMMVAFSSNPTVNKPGWEAYYESNLTAISAFSPLKNGITFYPNPASEQLFIHFNEIVSTNYQIRIFAPNGVVLTSKEFIASSEKGTYLIDINKIMPGIYFIQLKNEKNIYTKKLVIR